MAGAITRELMVGVTEIIRQGIDVACEGYGMRPSQYCRQAIFEKLIRDGILPPPTLRRVNNNSVPQQAAE